MTVLAIGLNHRTTPAELLDQVTFGPDDLHKALTEVTRSEVVTEAVVLSTCNRTEFYVHAERFHDGFRDVRDALCLLSGVAGEHIDPYLYVHYHAEAASHLFTVTAGLDSVVLGEHEILGQVARAWEHARIEGSSGTVLNLLFQRAVESGKKVRTDTDIGRSTASLSHAAVTLLGENHENLDGSRVLLVGAGELGADVATALRRKHEVALVVTNRTSERAAELADRLDGTTGSFDELDSLVREADIVVCATGAPGTVVDVDDLAAAGADHPVLVLDLAQPRDVPAEAARLDGVELIELPELQAFANRGLDARREHLGAAQVIVDAEVDRYRAASSAREVAPLIGSLHAWADGVRAGELDRYAARLKNMDEADRNAIEALSRSIVAKLLHQPTVSLKDAAGTARGDRLAEAVRELFDRT